MLMLSSLYGIFRSQTYYRRRIGTLQVLPFADDKQTAVFISIFFGVVR